MVKVTADGKVKHRLIQDLRHNEVNGSVALPEHQVLPRRVDHAADLAHASASDDCESLILDYEAAFMAVSPTQRRTAISAACSRTTVRASTLVTVSCNFNACCGIFSR